MLRRRQLIEPLPDFAHDAVARLLNEPALVSTTDLDAESAAESPAESAPEPEPVPAAQPENTVAMMPRAEIESSEHAAPLRAEPPPVPAARRSVPVEPAQPAPPPVRPPAVQAAQPAAPSRPAPFSSMTPPLRPFSAVESEKTIAIPRPNTDFRDEDQRPRATPSLKPIPVYAPVAPPDSAAAAPEKTVVIPRGGMTVAEYEPPEMGGSDTPRLELDYRSLSAHAASARRRPWKMRALWLVAALVAAGWFYQHRHSATPAAGPTAGILAGTLTAAVPPTPKPEPGTIIQDCPTCPRMIVLPPGRFKQGSAYDDREASAAEKPQHIVRIRKPLAMATTELTVANFREFVGDTKRELSGCDIYDGEWHHKANAGWQAPGFTQTDDHPVTCVSWNDALAYAKWLSAKTGHHYRLPSASEWEYAARSGSDAQVPWSPGLQAACENANVADRSAARSYPKWSVFACKDGYVNTAPVGSFKANAFGISDMLGNVFEWTQDCWHEDYAKAPIDGSARIDGDCSEHELRGGSWFSSPAFVRLAYRTHYATAYRSASIGVRLVRDMTP